MRFVHGAKAVAIHTLGLRASALLQANNGVGNLTTAVVSKLCAAPPNLAATALSHFSTLFPPSTPSFGCVCVYIYIYVPLVPAKLHRLSKTRSDCGRCSISLRIQP